MIQNATNTETGSQTPVTNKVDTGSRQEDRNGSCQNDRFLDDIVTSIVSIYDIPKERVLEIYREKKDRITSHSSLAVIIRDEHGYRRKIKEVSEQESSKKEYRWEWVVREAFLTAAEAGYFKVTTVHSSVFYYFLFHSNHKTKTIKTSAAVLARCTFQTVRSVRKVTKDFATWGLIEKTNKVDIKGQLSTYRIIVSKRYG